MLQVLNKKPSAWNSLRLIASKVISICTHETTHPMNMESIIWSWSSSFLARFTLTRIKELLSNVQIEHSISKAWIPTFSFHSEFSDDSLSWENIKYDPTRIILIYCNFYLSVVFILSIHRFINCVCIYTNCLRIFI
jgi:hypothetical protein